jgi:hypothetical protein
MPLSDDPWVEDNSIIDPERLHALGVVAVCWNLCERNLLLIFCVLFGLRGKPAWIIGNDIGDVSLQEKIRALLKSLKLPVDEHGTVLAYLKVYDACRQNRNLLSHFVPSMKKDDKGKDAIFLRAKGNIHNPSPIQSSLEDIRRVASELRHVCSYSWTLYKSLQSRREGQHSEMPPAIAAPELIWSPPPETDPKPKKEHPRSRGRNQRRKP